MTPPPPPDDAPAALASVSAAPPGDPRLPSLDRPDDDPRLWLEAVEGEAALAWVEARNAETLARLGGPRLEADRAEALAVLDRPDRVPVPSRRGGMLYNFWRDPANPRGLWRRTTMASYRSGRTEWETLLDLDALARDEGEDWVWAGATVVPAALGGPLDRAILRLSRGGGDATALREYHLGARAFVGGPEAGGFALPEAKGDVAWLDRDALLLSSAWGGEGFATASGYARTVRLWRRGEDPARAAVVFEGAAASMGVGAGVDRWGGAERVLYPERTGFFDAVVHLGDREGPRVRLDVPTDAWTHLHRGWLAVKTRTPWETGGETHAPDTLLAAPLDAFLAGERRMDVLFRPGPRRTLQGFAWTGGRLLVGALDDLRPVHEVLTPPAAPGGAWSRAPLPGVPGEGVVSAWPLDADEDESDGALLASVQDPTTPATLLLLEPEGAGLSAPAVLRRAPAVFDAAGLATVRYDAVAEDGERVPYVVTGPAGPPSGDAPVHLTGYGGFGVAVLPRGYGGLTGKLWLERGGTTVVAGLRGGGEFGTPWHEAGRRAGKATSHADFAAVAADLVARGITRPGRIAAEGGSNGGLLVANMLVRYPERFGAVFCTIPLADMRRYHRLLAGASWVAEYGDPGDAADWAFLGPLSAYHTAAAGEGVRYPPALVATTRRDDRVHPGHARKLAAKLRGLGHEALFHEPPAGGHGYGKDNAEVAAFTALGLAFLRRAIGWEAGEVAEGTTACA